MTIHQPTERCQYYHKFARLKLVRAAVQCQCQLSELSLNVVFISDRRQSRTVEPREVLAGGWDRQWPASKVSRMPWGPHTSHLTFTWHSPDTHLFTIRGGQTGAPSPGQRDVGTRQTTQVFFLQQLNYWVFNLNLILQHARALHDRPEDEHAGPGHGPGLCLHVTWGERQAG